MKLKGLFILLCFITYAVHAQSELTEVKKIKIITKLDSLIINNYVDSVKAKVVHEMLQGLIIDPRFPSIKDEKTLENVVNMYLQKATADGHLRFYFDK